MSLTKYDTIIFGEKNKMNNKYNEKYINSFSYGSDWIYSSYHIEKKDLDYRFIIIQKHDFV